MTFGRNPFDNCCTLLAKEGAVLRSGSEVEGRSCSPPVLSEGSFICFDFLFPWKDFQCSQELQITLKPAHKGRLNQDVPPRVHHGNMQLAKTLYKCT